MIVRLILTGTSGVGKSSLLKRYVDDIFHEGSMMETKGLDYKSKVLRVDDSCKFIKFLIWDLAGNEVYRIINQRFLGRAHGIIVVFDVLNRDSFLSLPAHIENVKRESPSNSIIRLCANKTDAPIDNWKVSRQEFSRFADENYLTLIETSARSDDSVQLLFTGFCKELNLYIQETILSSAQPSGQPGDQPTISQQTSASTSTSSYSTFLNYGDIESSTIQSVSRADKRVADDSPPISSLSVNLKSHRRVVWSVFLSIIALLSFMALAHRTESGDVSAPKSDSSTPANHGEDGLGGSLSLDGAVDSGVHPSVSTSKSKAGPSIEAFSHSDIDKASTSENPIRVACIGDSITWGYGTSAPMYSYPSNLGRILGDRYSVHNFGEDGVTAQRISKSHFRILK
jgi:small GTP-binding protein